MKNSFIKLCFLSTVILLIIASATSCQKEEDPKILGCTDPTSINYNPSATDDNGTCKYEGNVTFWYNSNGTQAKVTINGESRYITSYYPTYNPTCGSDGCANFTLEVGTYSYQAVSTWNTWEGNITVTKNGCYLMLLQ